MKHIKYFIQIILVAALIASCSESFLDTTQEGVKSEETFYNSLTNIGQAVTGTYGSLNIQPAGIHNLDMMYLVFGSIASDEAEGGGEQGGNDFLDIQHADLGSIQPSESKSLSDAFWAYNYKSILRANSTLAGISKFRSSNSSISADSLKLLNQYEGELYFILAFVHFKMVQVYGGIPIVDHPLSSSEYGVKRNSVGECLHAIQGWLQKSSNLLPVKGRTEVGRATKGAALSLLAKAYLYEASYAENYAGDARFAGCTNTYAKALACADSVISQNAGTYKLVGVNGEEYDTYWNQKKSTIYPVKTPGYRYIFTVAGENSDESVFEIQSVNDKDQYMLTRGTYLTIYTGVRDYVTAKGSSTTLGWGFNCPTQDLRNAYLSEGDTLRKKVTMGETGDPIYMTDGWGTLKCSQSPTNLIGRKYEASPDEFWNNRSSADGTGPNNFPYIRYADVVLMGAEAAIKAGVATLPLSGMSPLQLVNMVRKRARNGAVSGTPADLSSVNFESVVKERQLELALEGHRFFDLVRWKKQDIIAKQELRLFLGGVAQTPTQSSFTSPKNDFFPIPMAEVQYSGGNLKQYPGWE